MTKLKTLRDIDICSPVGVDDYEYIKYILRQEAINWVKELKYAGIDSMPIQNKEAEENAELIKEWIKRFFNLTEEDLK